MLKAKERNIKEMKGLSDVVFKEIIYHNEDILKEVLSETLEEKIGSIKYLNVEQNFLERRIKLIVYLEKEQSIVDIKVTDNYNITIVNRNVGNIEVLYKDIVNIDDDYTEYKTVKIINLIGNKKSEVFKSVYYLRNDEGKILTRNLTFSEIYIQSLVDLWHNRNEKEITKKKYLIMLGLNLEELKRFNEEYGDEIVNKYTKEFEKLLDNLTFEPLFDKEEDEK